jgi:DNA-binding CsgD family transcriptional regulator
LLQVLMPHLRRAALLQTELSLLRSERSALTQSLDRLSHALLITDSDGRLVFANTMARKILQEADGLTLCDNVLRASGSRKDALLKGLISKCTGDSGGSIARLAIPRSSGRVAYWLLVMPTLCAPLISAGVPSAAILIIDPESTPDLDPIMLHELFALTSAEARIATALAQGKNIEEISRSSGVSIETVRTHVRHILSKTATRRQGELISRVLRAATFDAT